MVVTYVVGAEDAAAYTAAKQPGIDASHDRACRQQVLFLIILALIVVVVLALALYLVFAR